MKDLGLRLLLAVATMLTLASCNGLIYEDEGDCTVTYRLKFRYDYNMKFADAFAHEVKSVRVYAFDKSGKLVWQKSEKGSALAEDGYSMELDLPAGDYDLIAWCGLDNDGTRQESFTVPEMTVGTSTKTDLQCYMNRKHAADGSAYIDTDLYGLYYGDLSVNLPENLDGGEYTYTMPLMKDTKHLRVILQHLSGENVDVSKFTFTIETHKTVADDKKANANGYLDWDNSLLSDELITYHTWNTESGEAEIEKNGVAQTEKVAIADLSFNRVMADREMDLVIRNDEGEEVIRVPFVDYAVLVKGYYNQDMSDQEYLDRQDEYSMIFFLDENENWLKAAIYINSWRIVLQNVDVES